MGERRRTTRISGGLGLALTLVLSTRCAPAPPSGDVLDAFPAARAMTTDAVAPQAVGERLHLETAPGGTWANVPVRAELPRSAEGSTRLRLAGSDETVTVTRVGARTSAAQVEGALVRYPEVTAGVDAIVFARPQEIEELLVLRGEAKLAYRLGLPPRWSARLEGAAVTLQDASGDGRLAMRADRAWDATGKELAVRVVLEHDVVSLAVDGPVSYPVVIDPSWSSALPPVRIRTGHTMTLLGDGRVLLAGGGTAPKTTEVLDPYRGRVELGPPLLVARRRHSATPLLSGRLLLAGGAGTASAELFDPATRTFTATGSMTKVREGHAALRLRSGKVLVVGGAAGDGTAELYDPSTGTWTPTPARTTTGSGSLVLLGSGKALFVDDRTDMPGHHAEIFDEAGGGSWAAVTAPLSQGFGPSTLTRLRDGRIAIGRTIACFSVGGPPDCDGLVEVFDPLGAGGAGTLSPGPAFATGRLAPSATLLPTGAVLFAGGGAEEVVRRAERFEGIGPVTLADDGALATGHGDPTAVLLPGGDVLVAGGSQAAIDRRVGLGTWRATGTMALAREDHAASRLHDGSVLLTGGDGPIGAGITATAELLDPVTGAFTAAGTMSSPRYKHRTTTLRSGKVLVTGGAQGTNPLTALASVELYDPAAPVATRFKALAPMAGARFDHQATLLPSGHVLVTGGCGAAANPNQCGTPLASAELFDPATEKLVSLPPMTRARSGHGAVVLPTGEVLIASGESAELFDPVTRTFTETTPPGSARDGRSATILPNGKVLLAGLPTLAAETYDATSRAWTFTGPAAALFVGSTWSALPDGKVVAVGGRMPTLGVSSLTQVFDVLAGAPGIFVSQGNDPLVTRHLHTATLTGTGELLVAGGTACFGPCVSDPRSDAALYGDGAPPSARPTLSKVPSEVTAGSKVTLEGSGFAFGPEGSSGLTSSSPTNHPLALWVSDVSDAVVPGTVLDFTDTTATWLVPATAYHGHGTLFVAAGGVLSHGASVTIEPAPAAISCAFDAECATRFCVDGVCCDRRCDGRCEGCSKARKQGGEDGVCGAVPPGKDIAGRCFSLQGQPCTEGLECATGFCAQGVCCDSSCTGECQACNLPDRAGLCSPINEGACGAICDGDHTLVQVGAPGVDCTPYRCEGPRCKTTCASVRDCAPPFVCGLDGQCVAPLDATRATDTVCGCRAAGADAGPGASAGALALATALGALRRARRKAR